MVKARGTDFPSTTRPMPSTGSGPDTPHAPLDSPDFWRAVADGLSCLLLLVDRQGTVLHANRWPDAHRVADLAGHSAYDLVPPESRGGLRAALPGIFDGAPPSTRQERGVNSDGTDRWTAVNVWGVRMQAGVVAAGVVVRDVTEQHRLVERARDWQGVDAFGQLSAGIVHDFNNVLAIVGAAAQLVADETRDHAATRADVETILFEVRRGLGLTRQLLALARRQPPFLGEVDLNEVVREAAALVRHVVRGSIEIVESLEPGGAIVHGDRSQLEQVVMNLVLNARDATPAGGTISLMTTRVAAGIRLLVSDTGSGICEETRAHLFEPFFTTRAKTGGTGLGLWTVQTIVNRARGTIDVFSQPGLGTTFVVTLPPAGGGRDDEPTPTPRPTAT